MKNKIKCFHCKKKNLTKIKDYFDKNNYERILYNCNDCGKNSTRIKSKAVIYNVQLKCFYCKKKTLRRAGYIYLKSGKVGKKRYHCTDCNKSMSFRNKIEIRGLSNKNCARIVKLVRMRADPNEIHPYDRRPIRNYYSSRAIVKMAWKKHKIKIGKTTTWNLIKNLREVKER